MNELTFTKKKKTEKPKIQGIETITVYKKGVFFKLGYCAYTIFEDQDKYLFDFCIN